jgi:hypothetical protein
MSDLISFQFLSHVSLVNCEIVDVSLFSNVNSVELNRCKKLTSLEGKSAEEENEIILLWWMSVTVLLTSTLLKCFHEESCERMFCDENELRSYHKMDGIIFNRIVLIK